MNPADLLAKINALPDFSDDERAYLRQHLTAQKQYDLVWENKPEAVEDDLRHNLPLLTELPERFIANHAHTHVQTCLHVSPPDGITQNGITQNGIAQNGRPIPIPFNESPAGDEPTGAAPAGDEPAGDEPAGAAPAGAAPAGDEPAGDEPAGDEPAGDEPAGDETQGCVCTRNHTLIEGDNLPTPSPR